MIRHLTSREPAVAACGLAWEGSALVDPRSAADLDDVSCPDCLHTDAFQDHAFRAAAANRRAMKLLTTQHAEISALRAQNAELANAGRVLAGKLRKTHATEEDTAKTA